MNYISSDILFFLPKRPPFRLSFFFERIFIAYRNNYKNILIQKSFLYDIIVKNLLSHILHIVILVVSQFDNTIGTLK